MNVRPADPEDATGIAAVARAAWWETYPGILDTDVIEATLEEVYDEEFVREAMRERDDLLYLVAEDDGVIGFATAQQTWADEVEIHTLYVEPSRWEAGIGTALLESVAASAAEAGADRLRVGVLSGNSVGRAFVETRGFERVETRTAAFGEREVPEDVFEKPL
ncbi:GNAT family N-acetyltransferase [Halorarius halobius]|uniref:GNAT family N-acetyltransferase n=1 Tax=Halorarius halobius TaxID=2962671 RepID=UPI0020CBF2A1|nr:GNAT family N-acetyltransferase [Halorarius halobius]